MNKETVPLLNSFPPMKRTEIREHKTFKTLQKAQEAVAQAAHKGVEEGSDEFKKLTGKLEAALAGAKKHMEKLKKVKTPKKEEKDEKKDKKPEKKEKSFAEKKREWLENVKDPKDKARIQKMNPKEFEAMAAALADEDEEGEGKKASMLRGQIVRLAHANPDGIRDHLLPLLLKSAKGGGEKPEKGKD